MGANSVLVKTIFMICLLTSITKSSQELQAIESIFSKCKKQSAQFDDCMRQAFNELRPYFKRGIPEIGVAPFDPHTVPEVNQTRTILGHQYTLSLQNVYEYGWTQSTVTKFKTNWAHATIFYSQYFPEKFLEGQYVFKCSALGPRVRAGRWNLTLRDYTQTTRVARSGAGAGVHVRVEIDRIGDMNMHITNLLNGRTALEELLDGVINTFWKPGFRIIRPVINDLVSSAFTQIWSQSFKHFNVQDFVKN